MRRHREHALVLDAHLIEASKLPPELQGQSVHVALMTPDAVLVQAPIAGEILTVCRDGDSLWATPGSKIQSLLEQATADRLGEEEKETGVAGGEDHGAAGTAGAAEGAGLSAGALPGGGRGR